MHLGALNSEVLFERDPKIPIYLPRQRAPKILTYYALLLSPVEPLVMQSGTSGDAFVLCSVVDIHETISFDPLSLFQEGSAPRYFC